MSLGNKLKQIRLQKNISQTAIAKKLGYVTNSYISDAESNKFVPSPEKLNSWLSLLGIKGDKAEELIVEAKLEELGVSDPAFTMMFKDVPNMTHEEKQSIIRAYDAVLASRGRKRSRQK